MGMTVAEAIELLKEDSAPYLKQIYIEHLVYNAVDQLNAIGFSCNRTDFELQFMESTFILGQCACGVFGDEPRHVIKLNRYICRAGLEDLIINNIYHELCHFLVNKEMFDTGRYIIYGGRARADLTDSERLAIFGEDGTGHSTAWFKYVDRVNKLLRPAIPITATVPDDIFKSFIAVNDDEVKFELYCKNCNRTNKILSYNCDDLSEGLLARVINDQENNQPNNYCNKCNGTIRIRYIDADAKEKIMLAEWEKIKANRQKILGGWGN